MKAEAPWTSSQVIKLNDHQRSSQFHPFTCPNRDDGHAPINSEQDILVATVRGWVCPFCDYTQDWAHAFMMGEFDVDIERAIERAREDEDRLEAGGGTVYEVHGGTLVNTKIALIVQGVIYTNQRYALDYRDGVIQNLGYLVGLVLRQDSSLDVVEVSDEIRRQIDLLPDDSTG